MGKKLNKYKVEIDFTCKYDLQKRFNLDNAKYVSKRGEWVISAKCPLCERYGCCHYCPLGAFATKRIKGCSVWLKNIAGSKILFWMSNTEVWWTDEDDEKVREQIKKINRVSEDIIQWRYREDEDDE